MPRGGPAVAPPRGTLRVLHFIDNLGPGGKERQLVELTKGCAAAGGFETLIVSMTGGVFYEELDALPRVSVRHLIRRWRKDPLIFAQLYKLVRAFRPQVLVAWDHMTAIYAIPAVKLAGVRFVNAMIQDAPQRLSWKARSRARLSFPFSDCIVGNSQAGLDAYGVGPRRGVVIHNGFDTGRLGTLEDPGVVRARYGIGDRLVVGMVATFRPTKDQPTLIRATGRILETRRDVSFLLVGDGETLEGCRALARSLPDGHVRFTGRLSAGLESLVNVFDVGVLATFTEGISNSIMEYMALGKPVVATHGGGTRELVIEGETGFLVPARDPRALADRLSTLLDDAALRAKMGRAGRQRLLTEFSLARLVERYRAVYARET